MSKELKKDPPIPPTVMSTGYEDKFHIASDLDYQICAALAGQPSLCVLPEPNFCVLVDDK